MNKIELGLPCSPSTLLSKEEIKVLKVIVSYAQNTEVLYLKSITKDGEGNPKVLYFNGHERILNPMFIVSMEEIRVAKVVTDVTAHRNYNKHVTEKEIETNCYEIKKNEEWVFTPAYIPSHFRILRERKINFSK